MARKPRIPKEPLSFEPVSSVIDDLVAQLIADHHPHLQAVKVRLVSRTQPAKRNGNPLLAVTKVVSGLNAWLGGSGKPYFVIEVCERLLGQVDEATRKAVLDHALTRCELVGTTLRLRAYDVQEFASVLHRNGPYYQRLRDFAQVAAKQLQLALEEDDAPTTMDESLAALQEEAV